MKKIDIADLVIEDIKKRKVQGKKKYGVPLRANNGRDALQDLYEELIDATQYCKQEMIERSEPTEEIELEYLLSLQVSAAVFGHYSKKMKFAKQTDAVKKELLMRFPIWVSDEIKKLQ